MRRIYRSIMSALLGVDVKKIDKILNGEEPQSPGKHKINEISVNIDVVSNNLKESKKIIDNTLIEMEKQKKIFDKVKKEAEEYETIVSIDMKQIDALNNLFDKREKEKLPINLSIQIFMTIFSAVLGFLLGKFF